MRRSFAFGDVHGELAALERILSRLPPLTPEDTLVFLGDYVDHGPASAQVVDALIQLPQSVPARVVTLRGNHEDAWLRVLDEGWGLSEYTPDDPTGLYQRGSVFALDTGSGSGGFLTALELPAVRVHDSRDSQA